MCQTFDIGSYRRLWKNVIVKQIVKNINYPFMCYKMMKTHHMMSRKITEVIIIEVFS